ncbi:MAG TPA: uroporphyrinogen decarboxylase family protein, partial [Spirochaetia bacterium]|nr:uroporphyrinogen decarboxylase family protein [Spirochaetia bacterium]
ERILAQIGHERTDFVPYGGFGLDDELELRITGKLGGQRWLAEVHGHDHIHNINHANAVFLDDWAAVKVGAEHVDRFGTTWRVDHRAYHITRPALIEASLSGYRFPVAPQFLPDGWRWAAQGEIERERDRFLILCLNGIFEGSWGIRGFESLLEDFLTSPEFAEELLEGMTNLLLGLLDTYLELPIDGILMYDDWGGQRGSLFGRERWVRFLKPRVQRVYGRIHAAGKIAIAHCCGNITELIPDLIDAGLDVLESVQPEAMDPYALKREFGKDLTFWGGLGTQGLIPFGAPDQIRQEVRRLCAEMGEGGGYILAPAKALQPETPTANALAVIEAFLEEAGVQLS